MNYVLADSPVSPCGHGATPQQPPLVAADSGHVVEHVDRLHGGEGERAEGLNGDTRNSERYD